MKKNYNYNYVNRQTAKKAPVEFSNVEVAACTSSVLAKNPIVDGRLWHTTDSNEFFYDWNGKRSKLNFTGSSDSLLVEINKIKADVAKLNPAHINQLENTINNAVTKINNVTTRVNTAISDAQAATEAANNAAQIAQDAASQVEDKASKQYVDDAIAAIELTPGEKGEKGDKGDQGEKGEKGDQGEKGEKGDQGLQGVAGEKGEKGDKGDQGETGEKGEKGDQGEKGEKGDKGDQGEAGEKGEKGDKGDQGEKGEKGDQGEQGLQGVAGEKGEKGDKGDQGEKGETGEKGDKGDQGEKGEKGDKGDQGEAGEKGEKGDQGEKGETGEKGEKGDQGEKGEKGDTGTFDDSALENYTTKNEIVERIGIVGQEAESNVYEYIYDKTSWEASYNDGVLKEYYTQYPNEDLWNFDTNSAPGFNDKIYTVEEYTDAACEGEYVVKQYKAQWYSDNGVQKIIDVNDNTIEYYIPTFFDTPTQIFELFAGAEGGYVATPDDLVYPCDKWIKVKEVNFGGPNVRPAWEAAVQAPGAQFPWIALKIENVSNKIVKFEYEGKDGVYPWGEKRFGLGGKSWGIASVAKQWGDNSFLIEANKNNGSEDWEGTLGEDFGQFNIADFKLVLVTPSSVKDYVDAAVASVDAPTEGVFPEVDASDPDDPTTAEADGFATVQDVMDYVNAMFEKKKDETPVIIDDNMYAYITGYLENATPTDITVFNPFKLNDEGDTTFEIIAPAEISTYDPSTYDLLPSLKFTIDIPVGYSIKSAELWNDIMEEYEDVMSDHRAFATNPRYSQRTINGITYNSYARGPVNEESANTVEKYRITITRQ